MDHQNLMGKKDLPPEAQKESIAPHTPHRRDVLKDTERRIGSEAFEVLRQWDTLKVERYGLERTEGYRRREADAVIEVEENNRRIEELQDRFYGLVPEARGLDTEWINEALGRGVDFEEIVERNALDEQRRENEVLSELQTELLRLEIESARSERRAKWRSNKDTSFPGQLRRAEEQASMSKEGLKKIGFFEGLLSPEGRSLKKALQEQLKEDLQRIAELQEQIDSGESERLERGEEAARREAEKKEEERMARIQSLKDEIKRRKA